MKRKIKSTNMKPGQGGCGKCQGFVAREYAPSPADVIGGFVLKEQMFCVNCGARESANHLFVEIDTIRKARRDKRAKLTERDVIIIREMADEGLSQGRIAKAFEVSRPHVSQVLSGKRWKYV